MKPLSQQRGEFGLIGCHVLEDVLDRCTKLRKGGVVAIARDLPLEELPEALDEIQVRRVRREIQQLNAVRLGRRGDGWRPVVGRVVEHHEQQDVGVGLADTGDERSDPLGVTRFPALPTDQALVIGGIGPKDVEAIPASVGLEDLRCFAFDPAATRKGGVQEMGRIEKEHLAAPRHGPLFSV